MHKPMGKHFREQRPGPASSQNHPALIWLTPDQGWAVTGRQYLNDRILKLLADGHRFGRRPSQP
jgi:hypothetical protein